MRRLIVIGALMKRPGGMLVTCLMVLAVARGVVQMADFVQNWPERLSHFVNELLSPDCRHRHNIEIWR